MKRNFWIILFLFMFSANIASAKLVGSISSGYFYDNENTIMKENMEKKEIKNIKFWEKNEFKQNQFETYSIISNKDLYRVFPIKKTIIREKEIPTVYTISFKQATVQQISLNNSKKVEEDNNLLYEKAKQTNNIDEKISAVLKLKKTNKSEALEILNQVILMDKNFAHAYYLKGEIYYSFEKYELSMENYAKAFQINPNSYQSCLGIAKILDKTNKELSQKYYQKAAMLQQ